MHFFLKCGFHEKPTLYYKIAQFVGNAVGVYMSGHTGAGGHRLLLQGVACGRGAPSRRRCVSHAAATVNKVKTTPGEARCRLVYKCDRYIAPCASLSHMSANGITFYCLLVLHESF